MDKYMMDIKVSQLATCRFEQARILKELLAPGINASEYGVLQLGLQDWVKEELLILHEIQNDICREYISHEIRGGSKDLGELGETSSTGCL